MRIAKRKDLRGTRRAVRQWDSVNSPRGSMLAWVSRSWCDDNLCKLTKHTYRHGHDGHKAVYNCFFKINFLIFYLLIIVLPRNKLAKFFRGEKLKKKKILLLTQQLWKYGKFQQSCKCKRDRTTSANFGSNNNNKKLIFYIIFIYHLSIKYQFKTYDEFYYCSERALL